MSDRRLDLAMSTVKRLFAVSGNRCAYPGCCTSVFDQTHDVVLGEIAHIHGPIRGSPRWSADLSNEECRSFANLILLCPTHHTLIDQAVEVYSAEALRAIKSQHETEADFPQSASVTILSRLLQKYRDVQSGVQYGLIYGGEIGWQGTVVRQYPDGAMVPMSAEDSERYATMRELAIEIGTLPTIPPAQPTRTDEFSKANRTVKILQMMLRYPDASFDEFLLHAVTRSSPK